MKTRRRPRTDELRREAEERLASAQPSTPKHLDADSARLVYELELHQHELELQNDELRAAHCKIEEGLQRYTELFDLAPIGYLVLGADGIILNVNIEAARLLTKARHELIARRFHLFVDPRHRERCVEFQERLHAAFAEERTNETCEVSLETTDGKVDVRLVGSLVAGTPPRTLVAMLDISPLRRAQAALLEEARLKDEFLAALSHELRNPLSPIRNAVALLEHEQLGERGRRAVAIIDRQASHLVRIVEDLLDVTRVARGKIVLERERLNLAELVHRTVEDHGPTFQTNGVTFALYLPGEQIWVHADQTRLVEIVGNLLVNAVKFTQSGGHVEVTLRRHDGEAILSVRDNGVGIAPKVLEHLFQPFIQGPQGLARTRGGLGLGLAMVKGLVELHGGSVVANSAGISRGSEFIVHLPTALAPEKPDEIAPAPVSEARRVLVIEDSADTGESLRELLTLEGHDVRVAQDGPEGLELALDFRPEVVLCDVGLPGMDGYEVARTMRRERELKGSYIVALTGYAHPEDRRMAAKAGFDRHLAKPPSTIDLRRVMAKAPGHSNHPHPAPA